MILYFIHSVNSKLKFHAFLKDSFLSLPDIFQVLLLPAQWFMDDRLLQLSISDSFFNFLKQNFVNFS